MDVSIDWVRDELADEIVVDYSEIGSASGTRSCYNQYIINFRGHRTKQMIMVSQVAVNFQQSSIPATPILTPAARIKTCDNTLFFLNF